MGLGKTLSLLSLVVKKKQDGSDGVQGGPSEGEWGNSDGVQGGPSDRG